PEAATAASALGLEALLDPTGGGGLDAAVGAASRHFAATAALLVVAADLPRLRPDDVTAVLERREPVVIAPTSDGGTAALLRRPPRAIPSAYGPGSGERHRALATAAGLAVATVDRAGLRHDVDTWDDLRALVHGHVGAATSNFLERIRPRLPPSGPGARLPPA
ncbi:MAG: NTP transferase domain-containing protein, partial [Actinomycetota bacterium]|nr:NTP transferase domain-containing protein [Actinomycetota bacterium]